jgi:surface polysaccharide O-acyltransferase-like enzyme
LGKINEEINNISYFNFFVLNLLMIIGRIIHNLNAGWLIKIVLVIIVALIFIVFQESNFKKKSKITQFGKINKYFYFGYLFLVLLTFS